MVNFQVSDYM